MPKTGKGLVVLDGHWKVGRMRFFSSSGCALREIVLINITGETVRLTAAITGVLAQGGVNILDIGQAVSTTRCRSTRGGNSQHRAGLVRAQGHTVFTAYKLDQQVRFTLVSEEDYQSWVAGQAKTPHRDAVDSAR